MNGIHQDGSVSQPLRDASDSECFLTYGICNLISTHSFADDQENYLIVFAVIRIKMTTASQFIVLSLEMLFSLN